MYVTLPVFPSHFLSLNVYTSVRIYHHLFLMYMYMSWSVFLSLFFYDFFYVCVRLYRHWLYVYRYVCYSAYLSISLYICLCQCPGILSVICMYVKKRVQLSQCVVALWKIYVLILRVYVRLLIRSSVSVSGYFITRCRCICTSFDPSLLVFSSEYFSHCSARL